jgi:hypothetical protein
VTDPYRRTGRTTQMLEEVRVAHIMGNPCFVVMATTREFQHAWTILKSLWQRSQPLPIINYASGDFDGIKFVTIDTELRGISRDAKVFVDHNAEDNRRTARHWEQVDVLRARGLLA